MARSKEHREALSFVEACKAGPRHEHPIGSIQIFECLYEQAANKYGGERRIPRKLGNEIQSVGQRWAAGQRSASAARARRSLSGARRRRRSRR